MTFLCRVCGHQAPPILDVCDACGSRRIVRHPELDMLTIAHLDCDAFYATIEKAGSTGACRRTGDRR